MSNILQVIRYVIVYVFSLFGIDSYNWLFTFDNHASEVSEIISVLMSNVNSFDHQKLKSLLFWRIHLIFDNDTKVREG